MSLLIHHVTTELGVHHQVRVDRSAIYAKSNSGLKLGDIVTHGQKRYAIYFVESGPIYDTLLTERLAR